MEMGGQITEEKKRGGRSESRCNQLFLSRHKRGGLVGIMEARKPDRQGRPTSLLASSLPRFINYCHVTAWLGLLMSVCVCVCLHALHVSAAMWVGPQRKVEAV